MKTLRKIVSHNQGQTSAIVIVAVLVLWIYGCQSKVSSLIDPSRQVTRAELEIEVERALKKPDADLDLILKQSKIKIAELDRQDEVKMALVDFAAITAEGKKVNPAGVAGLIFSVLGVGALADNRIKDKVIKNRPKEKQA